MILCQRSFSALPSCYSAEWALIHQRRQPKLAQNEQYGCCRPLSVRDRPGQPLFRSARNRQRRTAAPYICYLLTGALESLSTLTAQSLKCSNIVNSLAWGAFELTSAKAFNKESQYFASFALNIVTSITPSCFAIVRSCRSRRKHLSREEFSLTPVALTHVLDVAQKIL